jgi:multicomponent Na+:H+ antiporter subunit D
MTWHALLPLLLLATSLVPGLCIFALPEDRQRLRIVLNLSGAVLKVALVGVMLHGVVRGVVYEARLPLVGDLDLVLRADALGMLFVTLSAVLWLVTTVFAIGYMEHYRHKRRFFGHFSLCVSATVAIALAGNPITFLVAYEALSLSTYPLVVHRGDAESIRVGRNYLAYTLGGGAALMVATAWLHVLVGPVEFTPGGALRLPGAADPAQLVALFWLFIAALGVKTALVPLHGWLPDAMVAPAPVSALLHAVAVVKAGAFGVVRVVYEVFGVAGASELGVLGPLSIVASVTIIYGSVRALAQQDLKRRLAYSTVSQVSYIVLGASIFGPIATLGGLVHLVHQGIMKITLFFCVGAMSETLGISKVSELDGLGRRMPLTMIAFTIGALGMIGLPPLAGFVSKWYLGLGAVGGGEGWLLGVLVLSTLLNAAYFLPLVHAGWFRERQAPWPEDHRRGRLEGNAWLVVPAIATAALTLWAGVLAAGPASVQAWAEIVVRREYVP